MDSPEPCGSPQKLAQQSRHFNRPRTRSWIKKDRVVSFRYLYRPHLRAIQVSCVRNKVDHFVLKPYTAPFGYEELPESHSTV